MNKVSKTEDMLYEAMLDIGLKPERQYPISKMQVDFAFPEQMLVIEVDGAYKRTAEGMKTLFNRKRICEKEGWKVENFTAEEVFENPNSVAWRIFHILNKTNNNDKKIGDFAKDKPKKDFSAKNFFNSGQEHPYNQPVNWNIPPVSEEQKRVARKRLSKEIGEYSQQKKVEQRRKQLEKQIRKKNQPPSFFKAIGLWLLISVISFFIFGFEIGLIILIISFWIIIPIATWRFLKAG